MTMTDDDVAAGAGGSGTARAAAWPTRPSSPSPPAAGTDSARLPLPVRARPTSPALPWQPRPMSRSPQPPGSAPSWHRRTRRPCPAPPRRSQSRSAWTTSPPPPRRHWHHSTQRSARHLRSHHPELARSELSTAIGSRSIASERFVPLRGRKHGSRLWRGHEIGEHRRPF